MAVVVLARRSVYVERQRRGRKVRIGQINARVHDGNADTHSIGGARGHSNALDSLGNDLTGDCGPGCRTLSVDAETIGGALNGVNLAIGNDIQNRRLTP